MRPLWLTRALGLLAVTGCFAAPGAVEQDLRELTSRMNDPVTPAAVTAAVTTARAAPQELVADRMPQVPAAPAGEGKGVPSAAERLQVPADLPGARAAPVQPLPPLGDPRRHAAVVEQYPPIEPLPPLPMPAPGPEGHPLSLLGLQRLAETYSPALKNAVAAVEAAKGAARQAGAYPNPTFFLEQDTVQTFQAGYQGGGVDQVIKTMGKLKLAQAAAMVEVLNAKLALRRAQSDLRNQVRGAYFGVLVARENIRITDALFHFINEVYRMQVEVLEKGGFAAAYEPMQLRPLVLQAQLNALQARNQYEASWRQLAAAIGVTNMPPTELEGSVDLPVPVLNYNEVLARLQSHTDVLTALNGVQRARYVLQLAKVTPIPDVDVHVLVQKDYTTPPFQVVHSLAVSVPVPLWDQNKGNIHQAEAQLAQASVGPDLARNALVTTLADAYNRYATARRAVRITAQQVEDQVRAFRGVFTRRQQLPVEAKGDVSFGDVVTVQQTLVTYVTAYVTALGQQWQAVVDVANLLQSEDLFQAGRLESMPRVPRLDELLAPFGHEKGLKLEPPAPGEGPTLGPAPKLHGAFPAAVNAAAGKGPGLVGH